MRVVKVSEVSGVVLDWLVAKCDISSCWILDLESFIPNHRLGRINYSTKWAQGGPIIERIKGLQFKHWLESKPESCCEVHIHNYEGDWIAFGPTPLVAAMRCYVASKLGETVEVPDELFEAVN